MNVTPAHKRMKMFRLFLDGFSYRDVARMVGANRQTVMKYAHQMGLRRTNGHRSPIRYRHANQCGEWWQDHKAEVQFYDDAKLLELQWLALAGMVTKARMGIGKIPFIDADAIGYRQGKEYLLECRRILRDRTNRQKHNAKNAVVEGE